MIGTINSYDSGEISNSITSSPLSSPPSPHRTFKCAIASLAAKLILFPELVQPSLALAATARATSSLPWQGAPSFKLDRNTQEGCKSKYRTFFTIGRWTTFILIIIFNIIFLQLFGWFDFKLSRNGGSPAEENQKADCQVLMEMMQSVTILPTSMRKIFNQTEMP